MRFGTGEIAEITGGTVHGPPTAVDGAAIDSRTIAPGQLFVPIVARRDGHDFVERALERGAAAHLTSTGQRPGAATAVEVADTGTALLSLGGAARDRLDVPVVGITGSVGKTSTKDMLSSILRRRLRTVANPGSFNNELGVPLTFVNAEVGAEVLISEMGARGLGHVAELAAVARPTVGVVTRVVAAHTSEFASLEEIARAKRELLEALPRSGLAVLNADDPAVAAMAAVTAAEVLTFGTGDADVVAGRVRTGPDLRTRFELRHDRRHVGVHLAVAGRHHVTNALAAAATAIGLGLDLEEVTAGLAEARLSPWRMEVLTAASGATVINDAYNANPASVRAALETLAGSPARRKVAVLGAMAELGTTSGASHREIGREAEALGIELIEVGAGYGAAVHVSDWEEAVGAVGDTDADTAVLIKGSRVAGLERLAEALL